MIITFEDAKNLIRDYFCLIDGSIEDIGNGDGIPEGRAKEMKSLLNKYNEEYRKNLENDPHNEITFNITNFKKVK